jgi:eukaryotic-like serine/threonine-protein kinase
MSNTVAPGTILAEKYRLDSLIGRGGMGEVWRAEHLALRAPVAIKLMNPDIVANPEALSRFNREAQAAASLRSPHVVQILDHGLDSRIQAPFIAMELMEGESLAARIERVGCLSARDTARVVSHIARALSRAHEAGIVHRDLKPDNVFLIQNEDEEIAKVLDFGIAKANTQALGPSSATRTGSVMGTPYYMSPEQITGAKGVDHRTDLWALGVIACQCLTGRLPFNAETIGGLVIAICTQPLPRPSQLGAAPPAFDGWFERALARDPAHRFQSSRELADELRRVCGAESTHAAAEDRRLAPALGSTGVSTFSVGPVSHTTPGLPMHGPRRLGLVVAAGLVLLLSSGLASFWLFARHAASRANPGASASTLTAPASPPSAAAAPVEPAAAQLGSALEPAALALPLASASPASARSVAPPKPTPRSATPLPAARPAVAAPPPKSKPEIDSTSVFDRRKG